MKATTLILVAVLVGGCVSGERHPSWRGHLPAADRLVVAAQRAATSPSTWVPLVLAAGTAIDDWDDQSSRWAARERPLFGSDAASVSDTLRDVATGAYLITALTAPSASVQDKVSGLGVGVGTMLLEGGISEGLKSITSRQRPNGRGDKSFPSGHAGQAASRTALARRNLESFELRPWQRNSLNAGLHTIAVGAAWARVEAQKHHVSDVLVGMALGNFLANFMHNAFMVDAGAPGMGPQLGFQAMPNGGALRLSIPLR